MFKIVVSHKEISNWFLNALSVGPQQAAVVVSASDGGLTCGTRALKECIGMKW